MSEKTFSLEELNLKFGFDVTSPSTERKYVRARQGIWVAMNCNGLSHSRIGIIFNCTRQNISKGIDTFENKRLGKEQLALDYSLILEYYWL